MELDQLNLPSGAGWVKMRRRILWGDEEAVESAILVAQRREPAQLIHVLKRQRIFQLIEGWSLFLRSDGTVGLADSEKAQALPMEPESIDRLEPEDGQYLYEYAKHRFEVRGDVANPFVPASIASSPASDPPASSETK